MLFGLAIGLIVALGVYVNDRRPATEAASRASTGPPAASRTPPVDPSPARSTAPEETAENPDERFGFYELLPRFEVIVPELETPAARSQAVAIEEPGTYVLQAGSFTSETDAERLRAQLGLLGIESKIQRVTVDDREFYRVRIGPLDDLDQLNAYRRQLLDANIDSLVMQDRSTRRD